LVNEKQLNEMNIFQKDEIGLPSTFAAIIANVFQTCRFNERKYFPNGNYFLLVNRLAGI
jgi:hypothetical protein